MPKKLEITDLPLAAIRPGDNDRTVFDDAKLQELARSIAEIGLAQPITVRPITDPVFQFEIIAGERRFRACTLLGWATIPAIVRVLDDEQADGIMLAENVQRDDLNPMDEARAYRKRMTKYGWTIPHVAKKAKVSEKRVAARLALLDLVPEMQQMIASGQAGVQFGEVMSPLDPNRQRLALRYLATTERPLLREFRALCGKLLAEQAQDTLFDTLQAPEAYIAGAVDDHNALRSAELQRRFPLDPRLPPMTRVGSIGATFEAYLAKLLVSDDAYWRSVAPVVGTIYDGLLRGGMAFPPGTSPKRKNT